MAIVGFLRAVKPAWMNKTTELVSEGKNVEEIRKELNEFLSFEIESATTLRKTRDILMYTWVTPSDELARIRSSVLKVYPNNNNYRYALQYCMLLSAYPVFADICGLIGKLSTIQENFTTTWLKAKMYEGWGGRETVADSLKYILQSMRDFGVLDRPKIGTHRILVNRIESPEVINVLLLTILNLNGCSYYDVSDLTGVPQLFPFDFDVSLEWLHNSSDYHLNNYGGKMTVSNKK